MNFIKMNIRIVRRFDFFKGPNVILCFTLWTVQKKFEHILILICQYLEFLEYIVSKNKNCIFDCSFALYISQHKFIKIIFHL